MDSDEQLKQLTFALVALGRAVRDAVRAEHYTSDHQVDRHEGGDDIYGVDVRAESALVGNLDLLADFDGQMICEGLDTSLQVTSGDGPWRFIVDPVDGTRGYLAGKRSAWVLLGAGRNAETLAELEVGVAVEIPGPRVAGGVVASAYVGGGATSKIDPLTDQSKPSAETIRPPDVATSTPECTSTSETALRPDRAEKLDRCFVTVVRLLPGGHEAIGRFADQVLQGFEVYDDLAPCTGGQLIGLASGAEAAVIDPRPYFNHQLCAHPYDLAAVVIAREAGVIIEGLDGTPLSSRLDTTTPVAWVGYANAGVGDQLRPRIAAALTEMRRGSEGE